MRPSYEEFPVTPALAGLVDCYWRSRAGSTAPVRILPDGCVDLIFEGELARPRLVGTMSKARVVSSAEGTDLLGIRFKPGGARALLGLKAQGFVDAVEEWTEDSPGSESPVHDLKVGHLDAWLNLRRANLTAQERADCELSERCLRRTQSTVSELAQDLGLSRQHLRRRVLAATGLTPKQLQRVGRLQKIVTTLEGETGQLAPIAVQAGYYDQAHMNNEFKALTGTTVGDYVRHRDVPFLQDA